LGSGPGVAPSGFLLGAALCFLVSDRHDEALDGINLLNEFIGALVALKGRIWGRWCKEEIA